MIEWNRMIYLAVICRTFTKHSRKFSRKFSERGFKGGNKTGFQSCFLVHVVCIDYFYMSFYDHRHDYSRQRKWTGNEFYVCHYQFDSLDYEVQKADAMNSCPCPFFTSKFAQITMLIHMFITYNPTYMKIHNLHKDKNEPANISAVLKHSYLQQT